MKTALFTVAAAALLATAAGAADAQDTASEKGKLSYALGYRAGMELAPVIKAGEPLDMATLVMALQDAAAGKTSALPAEQLGAVVENMRRRLAAKQKAELEQRAAVNKTGSAAFLAQFRNKPGVKSTAEASYRVLETGNGAMPGFGSEVVIEYTISLPDGSVLADTRKAFAGQPAGPVTIRVNDIPLVGLRNTLTRMATGARWEIAIPAMYAYGTDVTRAGELAEQAVLVDIKLVKVQP